MEIKDLFVETKEVISEYRAKAEELDRQEEELKMELTALQEEMTDIISDQEGASLTERIRLKAQAKQINNKSDIIGTMLEEIYEARKALKLEFVPIYREAIAKDGRVKYEYEATKIAEKYRYLMLTEIAEIGKAMQSQFYEVAPDIHEVYKDPAVKEHYPRIAYHFERENYTPFFSWDTKSVVSKDEVFSATQGFLPNTLVKPKDVN